MDNQENNIQTLPTETVEINKSKKSKVLIIIIVSLVLLGVAGYFVWDNFFKEEKIDEVLVDFSSTSINPTIDCKKDSCTYKLKVKDDIINISITKSKIFDSAIEQDVVITKLKIADKLVLEENLSCGGLYKIETLEDIIIMSYHNTCDIIGNVIVGFNTEGEKIFEYGNNIFPSSKTKMFLVNEGADANSYYTISGKDIVFKGSSLFHGEVYLNGENTLNSIDMCNNALLKANGILDDTNVKQTYKITYMGNDTFTYISPSESTTFKSYKDSLGIEWTTTYCPSN